MQYYVVDAFTDAIFKGNPAGVCILEKELPDQVMQSIAFENNLSETAFLLKKGGEYFLRWFTPKIEVDLCGHATLATAFVFLNYLDRSAEKVSFRTQGGTLIVHKKDDFIIMDFPSRKPKPVEIPPTLERALSCKVMETHLSRDLLVLVEHESDVKSVVPSTAMVNEIKKLEFALAVTARGEDCDFVSRFFAPNEGVIEDPVTGSSHSTLIPFWSERLHKTKMIARQLSKRGGTLYCEYQGDRVYIGGKAVCYLSGEIYL